MPYYKVKPEDLSEVKADSEASRAAIETLGARMAAGTTSSADSDDALDQHSDNVALLREGANAVRATKTAVRRLTSKLL